MRTHSHTTLSITLRTLTAYKKRKLPLLANRCNLFRSSHLCLLGYERTGSVWHPQRSRLISLSLLDKQPVLRLTLPGILTHPLAVFYPELLGRQSFVTSQVKGASLNHTDSLKPTRNREIVRGTNCMGATQTVVLSVVLSPFPCMFFKQSKRLDKSRIAAL